MNPVASEAMALAGRRETVDWVERNARERLHPSLRDPSYLVLSRRRKILARWLRAVGVSSPSVLDVGGRIQPYRTLIPEPIRQYVAVDILNSPLVNIRASASAVASAAEPREASRSANGSGASSGFFARRAAPDAALQPAAAPAPQPQVL